MSYFSYDDFITVNLTPIYLWQQKEIKFKILSLIFLFLFPITFILSLVIAFGKNNV